MSSVSRRRPVTTLLVAPPAPTSDADSALALVAVDCFEAKAALVVRVDTAPPLLLRPPARPVLGDSVAASASAVLLCRDRRGDRRGAGDDDFAARFLVAGVVAPGVVAAGVVAPDVVAAPAVFDCRRGPDGDLRDGAGAGAAVPGVRW